MNRWILLPALLAFSFPPSDELKWHPDRKLSFADFKGSVPQGSPWAANTSSNIYFSFAKENGQVNAIEVYATFVTSRSWMSSKLRQVLSHEQAHFDLTEIFARRFFQEGKKFIGTPEAESKLKTLFKETNRQCNEMQSDYDAETQHGIDREKQEAWEKRISDLLKQTPPYPMGKERE